MQSENDIYFKMGTKILCILPLSKINIVIDFLAILPFILLKIQIYYIFFVLVCFITKED
jgi:hypothetical protein